ncbi:unnamed protein product [Linum tenue]|uniref:Uncharacterized protein n=1 Tax=Linum tenue TaxID=586396 RepID=A0AAV0HKH1_9ROSI|nr:unnamed protein product [Linum tenue]
MFPCYLHCPLARLRSKRLDEMMANQTLILVGPRVAAYIQTGKENQRGEEAHQEMPRESGLQWILTLTMMMILI